MTLGVREGAPTHRGCCVQGVLFKKLLSGSHKCRKLLRQTVAAYAFSPHEGDTLEGMAIKRVISEHEWLPWTGKSTGLKKICDGDTAEDQRFWQKVTFPTMCVLKCKMYFLVSLISPPGPHPEGKNRLPYLLVFKGVYLESTLTSGCSCGLNSRWDLWLHNGTPKTPAKHVEVNRTTCAGP